jgi:hypothetical protein
MTPRRSAVLLALGFMFGSGCTSAKRDAGKDVARDEAPIRAPALSALEVKCPQPEDFEVIISSQCLLDNSNWSDIPEAKCLAQGGVYKFLHVSISAPKVPQIRGPGCRMPDDPCFPGMPPESCCIPGMQPKSCEFLGGTMVECTSKDPNYSPVWYGPGETAATTVGPRQSMQVELGGDSKGWRFTCSYGNQFRAIYARRYTQGRCNFRKPVPDSPDFPSYSCEGASEDCDAICGPW